MTAGSTGSSRPALAVQEALHVGQERRELVVVAFLELGRIVRELVEDLAPRIVGTGLFEQLPVPLDLHRSPDGHQLQRPEDDLAELADDAGGRGMRLVGAHPGILTGRAGTTVRYTAGRGTST